ncbi:ChbG/HpnK family deacetylase [Iamia majanohamensis]|uniref:ChbG/HpnK family deacetylase n=1 Tax=Iamia majanohamensis TaxID=467976 RepID=A0AAE9Y5L9_9ACTN|nr:ChbG/HpnK family deacetylase [Iamia majanohamensis]WCO65896.1 ChbG/HpnK family deacetylase [Iamia majanohamensis]
MSERPVLVVNADDFGLTTGVCRGVLDAHAEGVVTSTSALVVAPAFRRHASALAASGIGVGLHVALVGEDPPLLGAREVPSLVDRRGALAPTWRHLVARAARGAVDPDDVRREAEAQLAVLRSAGIAPTHVDSHQNVHIWPAVARPLLALAVDHHVPGVRVPRSRRWTASGVGVRVLGARLRAAVRGHGLLTTDAAAGLDEAGTWDETSLVAAVHRLAADGGPAELATHPGADPDPERDRYRWGYRWADELDALCRPGLREAVDRCGFVLGDFGDLSPASGA